MDSNIDPDMVALLAEVLGSVTVGFPAGRRRPLMSDGIARFVAVEQAAVLAARGPGPAMSEQQGESVARCGCIVGQVHRYGCGLVGHVDPPRRDPAPEVADDEREALAEVIWTASRADEGTISAIGAQHVARAVLAEGWTRHARD